LAELATSDERSPLFGAGNAGVVARGGRLHRRDDDARSESYAEILARATTPALPAPNSGERSSEVASSASFAITAAPALWIAAPTVAVCPEP
ncbi:MAG: hypothetical protein ACK463_12545, partial [Bradyrhizobium sp.]